MNHRNPIPDLLRAAPPPGSLETREVRWFATGTLPADVTAWFESNGHAKTTEHRTDSYLLLGRPDIGIKCRDRSSLETKWRTQQAGSVDLAGVGVGHVEAWIKARRPLMEGEPEGRWVQVDKLVLTESRSLETAEGSATCEIEIASLDADGVTAWTLAFEAFGPGPLRSRVFQESIETFSAHRQLPSGFGRLTRSAGYPEWLTELDRFDSDGRRQAHQAHSA